MNKQGTFVALPRPKLKCNTCNHKNDLFSKLILKCESCIAS